MTAADGTIDASSRRRALRDVRAHGAADLAFAALYALVGFRLAPSRQPGFTVALGAVVALLATAGVALILRTRWARLVAFVAQTVLLLFAATCVLLLLASAAYLRGIYGALGTGMAALTLVAAALVVELCGLLPLFQLRMLLTPAVQALLEERAGARRDAGAKGVG